MCKKSFAAIVAISSFLFLLWPLALAQDGGTVLSGLSQQSNISEVMKWLDNNGLAQARIGVRTSSQPAVEGISPVVQQDAVPALSLFYSQGFKVIQGDTCGVTLRNDNTRLIAYSKLVQDPPSDQRYTAELYIPLNRLSLTKGKRPYRHTSNQDKAQLLGTWRTEFKSNSSQEDVMLTLFSPGQTVKLRVWKAETLTFTFENKETSQKFDMAFRQAIRICQPVKFVMQ
ncbi:MAG TPA: hypothetical protein VJ875_18515 [Pyrinomonadaceae bacterium]|nr:hypothetical protein [Pyrinomonadaceae bacterium]